ncbi:MAG: GNAT family N-acetyltransferase [Actinomycetota bacterium]|nr:GNAT family N-acetyltransferase [Actinomycetota bacterium]
MDEVSPTTGIDARISLREVTAETVRTVCDLSVAPDQRRLVASNAESIAEAYFSEAAWFRAVYADETPVGFLMLHDDPEKPGYYLWRFMIAEEHQGKGYGRRAMELLIEHVKTRPMAEELSLSYVPSEGSPEGFYRGLGFEPTGEENDGEVMMSLRLRRD